MPGLCQRRQRIAGGEQAPAHLRRADSVGAQSGVFRHAAITQQVGRVVFDVGAGARQLEAVGLLYLTDSGASEPSDLLERTGVVGGHRPSRLPQSVVIRVIISHAAVLLKRV